MQQKIATITITQDDIQSTQAFPLQNPVTSAIARELGLDPCIYLSCLEGFAFEMQAPYRTIYIPETVIRWLNDYDRGLPTEAFSFEIKWEMPLRAWELWTAEGSLKGDLYDVANAERQIFCEILSRKCSGNDKGANHHAEKTVPARNEPLKLHTR